MSIGNIIPKDYFPKAALHLTETSCTFPPQPPDDSLLEVAPEVMLFGESARYTCMDGGRLVDDETKDHILVLCSSATQDYEVPPEWPKCKPST